MMKSDMLKLFHGSPTECSKALGVSRRQVYNWSDDLPEEALMRVRTWYLATIGRVPKKWMPKPLASERSRQ